MSFTRKIKVAFVHDDFIQFGGAEKLFLDIVKEFSNDSRYEVTVFSSLISKKWKKIFENEGILYNESFLKNFPFCYHLSKIFFLFELYYIAFQSFDFDNFDIVISSSTRYAHSIITKPSTYHISYVNSLPKMFWEPEKYFAGKKFGFFLSNFFPYFQKLDFYTQKHADLVITNSKNISKKYKNNIKRNPIVLYPYINSNEGSSFEKGDFYLLISRMVSWKRIDYVLDTFSDLKGERIKIIGEGPELQTYRKEYSSKNIEFLGWVSEKDKFEYLKKSKGLIFPQDEDFGLVILEAIISKTPVVYYNKGGAGEILSSSVGVAFEFQNKDALIQAIKLNNSKIYRKEDFYLMSKRFSKDRFYKFLHTLIQIKLLKRSLDGKI